MCSRTLTDDTWEDVLRLWDFHTEYDELKSVDIVICLGSYDLRVAERCVEIIDLGLAKRAIVTGNLSNWTKKLFSQPEAEVFSKRIIELGVDPKKLLLEREATNLGENVIFSRRLCRDLLPSENTPVIFITKPQTQKRVKCTVQKVWREVNPVVTAPVLSCQEQAVDETGLEVLVNEMVGDIERLIHYPTKGFQIKCQGRRKIGPLGRRKSRPVVGRAAVGVRRAPWDQRLLTKQAGSRAHCPVRGNS